MHPARWDALTTSTSSRDQPTRSPTSRGWRILSPKLDRSQNLLTITNYVVVSNRRQRGPDGTQATRSNPRPHDLGADEPDRWPEARLRDDSRHRGDERGADGARNSLRSTRPARRRGLGRGPRPRRSPPPLSPHGPGSSNSARSARDNRERRPYWSRSIEGLRSEQTQDCQSCLQSVSPLVARSISRGGENSHCRPDRERSLPP